MKKKLLTLVVVFCLAAALAVPAMAAAGPGSATINDNDKANGTGNVGTGAATLTTDGIDDSTVTPGYTGDTKLHNATGPNSQDIDVQARIHAADAQIRYVIDISWGTMRFVYNRESMVWNPITHKYEAATTGASDGWLADNNTIKATGDPVETYLITEATPTKTADATTNNKIVVVNHSNAAVNASFTYNPVTGTGTTPLGGTANGGFYNTAAEAVTGAAANATGAAFNTLGNMHAALDRGKVFLYTGVGRNPTSNADIWAAVYFSLSGAPDVATTIASFTKVGTITVTIAPILAADTARFTTFNASGGETY